jgi:hypothetical protein
MARIDEKNLCASKKMAALLDLSFVLPAAAQSMRYQPQILRRG